MSSPGRNRMRHVKRRGARRVSGHVTSADLHQRITFQPAPDVPKGTQRFRVEIQSRGMVTAKRANALLIWILILAVPAGVFFPGVKALERAGNQPFYDILALAVGCAGAMLLGLLLAGLALDLIPGLYLKIGRRGDIRRENVLVTVDEHGVHIDGLEPFRWSMMNYSEPVRGDDYNGDDITLSSPGRLPVVIESREHIGELATEIEFHLNKFRHPSAVPSTAQSAR